MGKPISTPAAGRKRRWSWGDGDRKRPGKSYWAFIATLFLGRSLQGDGDLDGAARAYARAGTCCRTRGSNPAKPCC